MRQEDIYVYQYMQLKIADLLVNVENPRYESVEHQREAIDIMLHEQKEKMTKLAEHISEHGLSPIDTILVQPHENLWVVREGNRRITALKLLAQPELISDDLAKIKKAFKGLAANLDPLLLEKIPCVYCDSIEEANEWIRLKHTGENEGVGTVAWNPQQSGRFSLLTSDKPDPKMVFLEGLKTNPSVPEHIRKQLSGIHKTNFERLISDSKVREFVGISFEDGLYKIREPISREFLTVLSDLLGKKIKVNDIYYTIDRKNYIQKLEERIRTENNPNTIIYNGSTGIATSSNDYSTSSIPPLVTGGSAMPSHSTTVENPKKQSYPINRNTIIPATCTIPIEKGRIKAIFNELKSLPLDKHPNAAAVLFRVFVEFTVDHYITKKHTPGVSVDSDLGKKVEAVAQDFEANAIMSKHDLFAARKMVSSQNSTQSIKTFHSYIHNVNITPIAHDLCSAWDDILSFIQKIWEVI